MFKESETCRGFGVLEFEDLYGDVCSIQESSLATQEAIWLGIKEVDPKILARDTPEGGVGWVSYHVPDNVLLNSRMHLNREQCKILGEKLLQFAETGEIEDI